MQKTGLKTFAYSFSVSLFAIFVANGVCWHEHPSKAPEIKTPSKNITLFLKSDASFPSGASAPIKKIALNVLPEIKSDISPMVSEDEIIMADDFDLPEIPLEFSIPSLEAAQNGFDAPLSLAENAAPPPQPISQGEEGFQTPDKIVIPFQVPESTDIHPSPKASVPTSKKSAQKNTSSLSSAPTDIIDVAKKSNSKSSSEDFSAPLFAADEDANVPLLPLEKEHGNIILNKRAIKIADTQTPNQVALADKSIPIHSMEKNLSEPESKTKEAEMPLWETMADKKKDVSSPWLVAKADGALKNRKIAEEDFYKTSTSSLKEALSPSSIPQDGVKIASETVKNLLIPIPEDILNDENLTPQLSYTPQNSKSKDSSQPTELKVSMDTKNTSSEKVLASSEDVSDQKNKLLSSLDAIFSAKDKKKNSTARDSGILRTLHKKVEKNNMGKIMPTEMRLSFQPNRAEISGQTLRWIQAFAAKAAENGDMSIEIRIDGTAAMDLQQKRLNLLHNILADKGVEYSKINTVFTQREPNSFIIKTITHNKPKGVNGNLNKAANGHYITW